METNNLYPVFLKLDEIQTLIVGGGNIGLEKVRFILRQSPQAKIKVVAKEFHLELIGVAIKYKNVQIKERAFVEDDLQGVKLLIIATNISELNQKIKIIAEQKNILTNVVDNPPLCDFYTGAVMNKGAIKVAVSSNGASPTLAKRLRDVFVEIIPDEVETSADYLKSIRSKIKGDLGLKIKSLNTITEVLSHDFNHSEQLKENSVLHHINLN